MSTELMVVALVGIVALTVIALCALNVLREVRIARWTAQDPRNNATEVADAAAKVASRRRHPSAGDEGTPKET